MTKKIKARNKEFAELRATGALRQRVVRDRTKYTRKQKHKKGAY